MRCEKCNCEMMIDRSFYRKNGEKFFIVQEMSCHNPKCQNKGEKKEGLHELKTE